MSFGFSVGDFIGAIELVNKIRKEFVNAPSQLKSIGNEVRGLSIVLGDADVACAQETLNDKQKKKLDGIDKSCRDVLDELQQILDQNREVVSGSRGIGKRVVRMWKRIKWDPEVINELRSRITSNIALLNAFNGQFTRDNMVKLVHHQDDQERQAILDWISSVDFPSQQKDIISRRQDGTGLWLLDSEEYKAWSSLKGQTLFCPGIPGAGKTILSAIVVDDLNARFRDDESVGIAYVYFNFRRQEEQKLEIILAGILKQLLQSRPSLPESIKALYSRHKQDQTPWPTADTLKELRSVVALYSRVFIVADALDECQNEHRTNFLSGVFDLKADTKLGLFATSRFIPEITSRFENSHRFLLAKLHLESLVGKRSLKAINTALKRLETPEHTTGKHATVSEAYDRAYDDAMERIKGQVKDSSELAEQVISWITLACRPLTTLELLHALAIEIGESELDKTNIPELEDIVSVCAGLVIVDEESNIIRLVHYTTQEYFERTHPRWFPKAQTGIANSCLTYLAFDSFETGPAPSRDEFDARLGDNALYEYAALNWGHHARLASIEADTLILSLFESQAKLSSSTQVIIVAAEIDFPSQDDARKMIGMHVAAYFGLQNVISSLLEKRQDPDPRCHNGRTPLSWASEEGHLEVVKMLLAKPSVNVNSKSSARAEFNKVRGYYHRGMTALMIAAMRGHERIVELLLQTGKVDKTITNKDGRTALWYATENGYSNIVSLLQDEV
ncbi:Ankyrin repeat,PH and SEC7 domain containing protein [Lachnellula willkommii]|uniref:Ankyrin repeat,PH and SEC7 domain containing protein n=1 Tax=Lachnellula willkommii TaxID=215461 RepID=A0A559M1J9_9HELO|nr:Ankyrin repeat,PH and SEC7 domain containing protein [Lachnellula willkommii]